jgi:hypothetical protein
MGTCFLEVGPMTDGNEDVVHTVALSDIVVDIVGGYDLEL